MTNEQQASRPALAPERKVEAERLLLAILREPADLRLPEMWRVICSGDVGDIYADLCYIVITASEDGYGDGYIDGRADERAEKEITDYHEEWE